MLGYLGGVTLMAMLLCRNDLKPPVLVLWVLFLLVSVAWEAGTGALAGGLPL